MQDTWRWALTILIAAAAIPAGGQELPKRLDETPRAKSAYTLFQLTPTALLREMSTDRPDQTESPYTVDAGHFQVEMDLVNVAFDRNYSGGRDVRTTLWRVAPPNLKLGLLNNVDVQFVFDPYVRLRVRDRAAGRVISVSGFGDLQTRFKINLWGNDGGRTAFSVMPFVKWPLPHSDLRNGKTEGGVIFPFALDLGRGWDLGAMTELDFTARDAGGYATEFVNSITVGRAVTSRLRVYGEFFSLVSPSPGFQWEGQADAGWTYALRENVQLDAGCNFGVTRAAPDFELFMGISLRR